MPTALATSLKVISSSALLQIKKEEEFGTYLKTSITNNNTIWLVGYAFADDKDLIQMGTTGFESSLNVWKQMQMQDGLNLWECLISMTGRAIEEYDKVHDGWLTSFGKMMANGIMLPKKTFRPNWWSRMSVVSTPSYPPSGNCGSIWSPWWHTSWSQQIPSCGLQTWNVH
jgi:hypothetical protein